MRSSAPSQRRTALAPRSPSTRPPPSSRALSFSLSARRPVSRPRAGAGTFGRRLMIGRQFDIIRNMKQSAHADAVARLGALAQETRLALFRLLVDAGPAGLTPGVVAERLDV